MSEHLVSFDSGKPEIQWRGYFRTLLYQQNWVFSIAVFAVLLFFKLHIIVLFLLGAMLAALGITALEIRQRCRGGPRICTASINETGVRGVSSEDDITVGWPHVRKIKIHSGDVFLLTMSGAVHVPFSAFADLEAAYKFYYDALALWNENRGNKTLLKFNGPSPSATNGILASDPMPTQKTAALGSELDDWQFGDEAVWKELEANHARMNSDNQSQAIIKADREKDVE